MPAFSLLRVIEHCRFSPPEPEGATAGKARSSRRCAPQDDGSCCCARGVGANGVCWCGAVRCVQRALPAGVSTPHPAAVSTPHPVVARSAQRDVATLPLVCRGVSAGRKGKVLTSLRSSGRRELLLRTGCWCERGVLVRRGAVCTARPTRRRINASPRRRINAPPRRCEERVARRGNLAFGLPGRIGWTKRQGPHVAALLRTTGCWCERRVSATRQPCLSTLQDPDIGRQVFPRRVQLSDQVQFALPAPGFDLLFPCNRALGRGVTLTPDEFLTVIAFSKTRHCSALMGLQTTAKVAGYPRVEDRIAGVGEDVHEKLFRHGSAHLELIRKPLNRSQPMMPRRCEERVSATWQPCLWLRLGVPAGRKGKVLTSLRSSGRRGVGANGVLMLCGAVRTARPTRRRINAPPRRRINAPRPSLRVARRGNLAFGLPGAHRLAGKAFARGVPAGKARSSRRCAPQDDGVVVANGVLERTARRGNLAFHPAPRLDIPRNNCRPAHHTNSVLVTR